MISSYPMFTSSPTYHHFWFHYHCCYFLCIYLYTQYWCNLHHIDIFVMEGMLPHKRRISDLYFTKKFCTYFLSLTDFQVLLNFSLLGLEENQKHRVVRKVKAIYYGQWWKIRDSSDGINQKRTVVLIMYALIHYENSLLQIMGCIS